MPSSHGPVVRSLLFGMLDWMLAAALVMGLYSVVQGGQHLAREGGRWTLGALMFGFHGAFLGATIGGTAWASWTMTRYRNLLSGLLAGMIVGLNLSALFKAANQPLAIMVLRIPDPFLPAIKSALVTWFVDVRETGMTILLVAALVSCVARLTARKAEGEAGDSGAAAPS